MKHQTKSLDAASVASMSNYYVILNYCVDKGFSYDDFQGLFSSHGTGFYTLKKSVCSQNDLVSQNNNLLLHNDEKPSQIDDL